MTTTTAPNASTTLVVEQTSFVDFMCWVSTGGGGGSCILAIVFAGRTYTAADTPVDPAAVDDVACGSLPETIREVCRVRDIWVGAA